MSLTDDLKDGKLCTGDYFYNDHHAKGVCRVIGNLVLFPGNEKSFFYSNLKEQGFEVLAPCDYEELQDLKESCHQLKNSLDFAIQANEKALQENALLQIDINRLKEALNIELLSSRIHTIWSNWFLHQRDLSTEDNLARWNKQAHTRYEDLSDADKEKDRKIVKNLLFEVLSGESEVLK